MGVAAKEGVRLVSDGHETAKNAAEAPKLGPAGGGLSLGLKVARIFPRASNNEEDNSKGLCCKHYISRQ